MIRPPPRSTLFPYTPLSRSDTQEEPPVLIEDGDKIDWPVLGNELRLEGLLYRLNLDLVQSARSIEDESIGRFFLHQRAYLLENSFEPRLRKCDLPRG